MFVHDNGLFKGVTLYTKNNKSYQNAVVNQTVDYALFRQQFYKNIVFFKVNVLLKYELIVSSIKQSYNLQNIIIYSFREDN